MHNRAMIENAKKRVYMCSSDKIGKSVKIVQSTLDEVDYFISDKEMDEDLKKKFKNTKFIKA